MAKHSEDREDLLREATALVQRAEFTVGGQDESYVAGFRRDGSVSLFFGVDPVYQFNKSNELRRAYRNGFLIKAEQGRLVRLERKRTASAVELVRHEMSDSEQRSFLDELVEHISDLGKSLMHGDYELVGQVPKDGEVMQSISLWLSEVSLPPKVASSPRVGKMKRPHP